MSTRMEKDPLGEKPVPTDALYGIQTLRAAENFPISGLRPLPAFVDAVVMIKRCAAETGRRAGSNRNTPTRSSGRPTRCSPDSIATSSSSTRTRPGPVHRTT